ncbi:hypothetical protein HanLR1_Chr17g0650841 [Helianthus annuus]|nr:hypothetical protein HanHA89_Chr17g0691651 [Helianthus annuus]KAJ0631145.1 hypothetical protein HanLR1_Chr17g0650841 [Helianthus annuus]
MTGSQLFTLFIFAPTLIPKYTKGTVPILQPKTSDILSTSMFDTPNPKRLDFNRLIFNPEHTLKTLNSLVTVLTFSNDQIPIIKASSAYRRRDSSNPPFGSLTPLNNFKDVALLIILANASITMMKRNGEIGPSCLIPFEQLNINVGEPFTKIDDEADANTPFIHLHHLSGNPICLLISKRKSQFTLSYAFSKSLFIKNNRLLFFCAHAIISLIIKGPSRMCLPDKNAD